MKLVERFWTTVSYLGSILTLSPFHDGSLHQTPLSKNIETSFTKVPWPRFYPPTGSLFGDAAKFFCDYPDMLGWEPCFNDTNQCWLRNRSNPNEVFDIYTNYENYAPKGILREYDLRLVDSYFDADGQNFPFAKLFNNKYPGPWIQACWGDVLRITVKNQLNHNGTSVHWHGIRQNQTMQMDGVNGVTQCPIKPNDYFVYEFNVTQYGSSWYHSHYSVQYADGAAGPLTLHGPTSDNYDEAKDPLIMTDWAHNSAFNYTYVINGAPGPANSSILLNGRGDVRRMPGVANMTEVLPAYNITFEKKQDGVRAKKYLLRLINTSFETTFIFSIDNHVLQIVEADFVPIHPYKATSVLVGIGQRYHIIVEADPVAYGDNILPADGNYWIRTNISDCFKFGATFPPHYSEAGILRYNDSSKANPNTNMWGNISALCSDEPVSRLKPIVKWDIGKAANGQPSDQFGESFDLQTRPSNVTSPKDYPLSFFSLGKMLDNTSPAWMPLRVNYSEPIFLELDQHPKAWPENWVVVKEDYTERDWVYLVISGTFGGKTASAHPIHLHGHDFAILAQVSNAPFDPNNFVPNLDNPARRDVVLLPDNGYVVIAFKTDNPGAWLVHCHIAIHASWGLGMQILERQDAANALWPHGKTPAQDSPAIQEANRVCKNWIDWQSDPRNWDPIAQKDDLFQDDSGV